MGIRIGFLALSIGASIFGWRSELTLGHERMGEPACGVPAGPNGSSLVPRKETIVVVFDDHLNPIQGVSVQVSDGNSGGALETDATGPTGSTSALGFDAMAGFELTLADAMTPNGIALGMVQYVPVPTPTDNSVDVHRWIRSVTMPLAEPITIQGSLVGSSNVFPAESYPHWTIVTAEASQLTFNAHAAILMDSASIDSYLAYRGVSPMGAGYVRAAVLVTPSVRTGDGFLVGIKLHGELAGQVPAVDAYNIYAPSRRFVGIPPLDVEYVFTDNDTAFFNVTGTIRKGHLALCVRSSTGGDDQVYSIQDNPVEVIAKRNESVDESDSKLAMGNSKAGAGENHRTRSLASSVVGKELSEGTAVLVRAQDCIPAQPMPPANWSCTPDTPTACSSTLTFIATDCKTNAVNLGMVCKTANGSESSQDVVVEEFKVALDLGSNSAPGSSPIKAGATFEYGWSKSTVTTNAWTAMAGVNGVGQCKKDWQMYLVCASRWSGQRDVYSWNPHDRQRVRLPCFESATITRVCTDNYMSQTICDRLP